LRHALALSFLLGCAPADDPALVTLVNAFDDPDAPRQPPWTICEAAYLDARFDAALAPGEASDPTEVEAGLGPVYMVASFGDPACPEANLSPLVSAVEEETLPGQERDLTIALANHRGPCPPEGVEPMSEAAWDAVRERWPELDFPAFADRDTIALCAGDE
jgi:hypothetical protein